MGLILLIFMTDIVSLSISNEGYFTFIMLVLFNVFFIKW